MIFLLLILLLLIVTGAFWLVVKVALGVALGLIVAIAAVSAFVWWRVRKALRSQSPRQIKPSSNGGHGSSEVTVYYREPKD